MQQRQVRHAAQIHLFQTFGGRRGRTPVTLPARPTDGPWGAVRAPCRVRSAVSPAEAGPLQRHTPALGPEAPHTPL